MFDPNGIPIEFSVNVKDRNVRKPPKIVDSNPSKITLEGSEPTPDIWPKVTSPTKKSNMITYRGAGSELFHGKKLQF